MQGWMSADPLQTASELDIVRSGVYELRRLQPVQRRRVEPALSEPLGDLLDADEVDVEEAALRESASQVVARRDGWGYDGDRRERVRRLRGVDHVREPRRQVGAEALEFDQGRVIGHSLVDAKPRRHAATSGRMGQWYPR